MLIRFGLAIMYINIYKSLLQPAAPVLFRLVKLIIALHDNITEVCYSGEHVLLR